jgi:hypothetical protein
VEYPEDDREVYRLPRWRRLVAWGLRPLVRMIESEEPLDAYGLVHMASTAGDALVAVALADSVFFSLPVGEARGKVALYLGLTMAPLAVAGPLLVPLLDLGRYRRLISFAAAAGRAGIAIYAAPRFGSLLLFPTAFALLVLSRIHGITKNGLTMAYAPVGEKLVRVNARLGRIAAVGASLALAFGLIFLKAGGAGAVLYLAAAVYIVCMFLNLRLPHPFRDAIAPIEVDVDRRGRVPRLAPAAVGTAGLRGASGFLLFLLAFALRRSGQPTYWFGVLAVAAAVGGVVGDLIAPRLPRWLREEGVVIMALLAAGVGALLAFEAFGLFWLAVFSGLVGAATEFGRLAFQSLMQRTAPGGAQGRVFVRYEVVFQLAWVVGAFLPAILPIEFRTGILVLAAFYLVLALSYFLRPYFERRRAQAAHPSSS